MAEGAPGPAPVSPWMGVAGELGGSLISSAASFFGQREQRRWEERMSNTAYQRASADMKAAGLNPSMMYGSGSAANVPNVAPPQFSNPAEGLTRSLQTAASVAFEAKRVDNESLLADAEAARKRAETLDLALRPELTRAQAESARAGIGKTQSETELSKGLVLQLPAKLQNILADTKLKVSSARAQDAGVPEKAARGSVATLLDEVLTGPLKYGRGWKGGPAPLQGVIQPILDIILGKPGGRGNVKETGGGVKSGGASSAREASRYDERPWSWGPRGGK